MHRYNTRTELLSLIPEKSKILEIGVFEGGFSSELLTTNPEELYLVDIWSGSWGSGDKDGNYHKQIDDMEQLYLSLYEKYKTDSNVHVIRSSSTTFLNSIQGELFDMIYVDGDHEEASVLNDMINSYRIIKDGGWLMGHDYHFQIKTAVDAFCQQYSQQISFVTNDGCPSFAIKIKK